MTMSNRPTQSRSIVIEDAPEHLFSIPATGQETLDIYHQGVHYEIKKTSMIGRTLGLGQKL